MIKIAKICFFIVCIIFMFLLVRIGMVHFKFNHSVLDCIVRDWPTVDCKNDFVGSFLNFPIFFFVFYPLRTYFELTEGVVYIHDYNTFTGALFFAGRLVCSLIFLIGVFIGAPTIFVKWVRRDPPREI